MIFTSDDTSRGSIPEGRVIDGASSEVVGLLIGQVVVVALVEDTVGIDRAGADGVNFST